jgi:hypothetical protein
VAGVQDGRPHLLAAGKCPVVHDDNHFPAAVQLVAARYAFLPFGEPGQQRPGARVESLWQLECVGHQQSLLVSRG